MTTRPFTHVLTATEQFDKSRFDQDIENRDDPLIEFNEFINGAQNRSDSMLLLQTRDTDALLEEVGNYEFMHHNSRFGGITKDMTHHRLEVYVIRPKAKIVIG